MNWNMRPPYCNRTSPKLLKTLGLRANLYNYRRLGGQEISILEKQDYFRAWIYIAGHHLIQASVGIVSANHCVIRIPINASTNLPQSQTPGTPQTDTENRQKALMPNTTPTLNDLRLVKLLNLTTE